MTKAVKMKSNSLLADEKSKKNYKKMTETGVGKLIITLGIPATVSMLITNVYNMADTYFVGGLGESEQAATGILFTLQAVIQAIAFMLGHGSGTYVSKQLSENDIDGASEYVSSAFFLGGAFGVLLTVVGFVFASPFLRLLGSTDTILPHAKSYGTWVLISSPFMICSLIMNNNLRYEGKAVYAMIGLTTGGLLNILLDFIFVKIACLGVFGVGMATAVSQTISFLLLFIIYITKAQSNITPKKISHKFRIYNQIVKVGLPSLLRQGLNSLSNGVLNNVTKPYGDGAIAAMSIVNKYSSFVVCVGLGIGQGFQPLAAFNYSVKKYDRVKKGLLFTTCIGFLLVGGLAVVGLIFAEKIVWLFQKSPEVIVLGSPAVRYASIGSLFLALSIPTNMLYQSTRKALQSSVLSLMRSGLAFMPVLLIFSHVWGFTGIALSQPIADVISALATLPFTVAFLKKKNFD